MSQETWTRKRLWGDEIDPATGQLKEDWAILRNGVEVGRIYAQWGGMEHRLFWSWFLNKMHSINAVRTGRANSYDEARAQFVEAWQEIVDGHGIAIVEQALLPIWERAAPLENDLSAQC